jgi:aminopeptidase
MSVYESLAKNVIRRGLRVKPKENVIVETWNHGLPIATEFVYQLRAAGARPMLLFEDEPTYWRSLSTLPKPKLGQVGSHEWKALEEADAYVFVTGPADIVKVRETGDKYDAATAYNSEWYKRAKKARLRGARIGLGYVTGERAAAYGLDVDDWRRMMLDASSVDPREIVRRGRKLRTLLSRRGRVEITAPNGTRFTCDLLGRKAGISDGVVDDEDMDRGENMTDVPAGEVFVAPDEKSASGTLVFDRPLAYVGRWVRGLRLAFDDGRLSKWSAEENADPIRARWEKAKGDKDRLGMLNFGLNPNARTGFLQDYVASGSVYVSVGDNSEVGGKNKTDFFLGCTLTGATVTIDGAAVVKGGQLVV